MKLKHNKKRNTAFLYESLVKELTKAVVKKDIERKNVLVSMIKEHFSKGTILNQELELYKALNETTSMDVYTAERLLSEAKKQFSELNREEVFESQSMLIEKINKDIGKDFFSNFVPNYKTLASIAQIFSDSSTAKEKVLLERSIIGRLAAKPNLGAPVEEMKPIDKLVFKKIIENFNEKYNGKLLNEQQELLNHYILSFDNADLEFKVYLNEELSRVKESLNTLEENANIQNDKDLVTKLQEVKHTVGKFQTRKIDSKMIEKIMTVQSLIAECNS
tara:strand:+ start:343 stop:1170 length:828 start_codon:yes stop_codon:yes gene_type:complete